ncbi:hypothetical protein HED54_17805 [Ochrobactrum anthropi ATCC 49188]|nr:hypothetical protein [Brucella anthropi ATCC 49188]
MNGALITKSMKESKAQIKQSRCLFKSFHNMYTASVRQGGNQPVLQQACDNDPLSVKRWNHTSL